MNTDELIGFTVGVLALLVVCLLTLWSRWLINLIAKKRLGSLRDIKQELGRGR
jgi:hypothetical protein